MPNKQTLPLPFKPGVALELASWDRAWVSLDKAHSWSIAQVLGCSQAEPDAVLLTLPWPLVFPERYDF
jgi:hypothetical protein